MLRGGTWVTCPVEQGTPLMTAGGVTPIGRATVRGQLIVQLGSARMLWEAKTVESMSLPTLVMMIDPIG